MRKRTMLMCALIMLLLLAGVVSASPAQPENFRFRIEGITTLIDFRGFPSVFLKSEGRVIQHIQGTFTMNETVIFGFELPFSNSGTLTITTKKGDRLSIAFEGFADMENVWGDFWVTSGTGVYKGFTGSGTFDGTADPCNVPCNPWTDPLCRIRIKEPDCPGFYVDFTFDS